MPTNYDWYIFDCGVSCESNINLVMPLSTNASVLYNINNYVGVTNFDTMYGLAVNEFNCYTYAIGKYVPSHDPGYYLGYTLTSSNITLARAKLYTEYDQEALGRYIYDTTVNASHDSHSWKIALRVREGADYHFMKKSYGSSASWEFKAGRTGPVMRLLNGYNPGQVSWDKYGADMYGNYVVSNSGYYTGNIKYMLIQE